MISLASLSLTMQAAGAVSGAIGGFYSAKMSKQQLAFEASMADINARIAELGARQELFNGQAEVGKLTLAAGQLKAKQRTAMGANNIVMGEGSAAEIAASTEIMKQLDVNTIEANAVRSAWGYRSQGANYQAEAATKSATASSISPFSAGALSLLTGASQVAKSWYQVQNPGKFLYPGVSNSPSNSAPGGTFGAPASTGNWWG